MSCPEGGFYPSGAFLTGKFHKISKFFQKHVDIY